MTKQDAGSTPSLPASDQGNTAGWGGKKINPVSHPFVVSDLDHRYPAIRRRSSTVVYNSLKFDRTRENSEKSNMKLDSRRSHKKLLLFYHNFTTSCNFLVKNESPIGEVVYVVLSQRN